MWWWLTGKIKKKYSRRERKKGEGGVSRKLDDRMIQMIAEVIQSWNVDEKGHFGWVSQTEFPNQLDQ